VKRLLNTICHPFYSPYRSLRQDSPSAELAEYFNQDPQLSSPSIEPQVQKAEGPSFSSALHQSAADWLKEASKYHGDGTAYSDTVSDGKGFACSMREIADPFKSHFAAINAKQWEDGKACGRCVKARCVDDRCLVKNKDVVVQIVDLCPECKEGDVDFSFAAYKDITGLWPHRLSVEWEFVSCAPEIEGTIKFWPKDGQNPWFTSFYLSGSRYPIKSLKLNGQEMERSPYQFFTLHGSMPQGGATLEITADSGAVVTAKVGSFYEEQDLKVQFPGDI
jgi:expansin (peptidoglycan-binding protein)